jgi:phosphonate transport system substrate-binding protein
MSYTYTVSPDFSPECLSGWYIFNTWLQKQTKIGIHLEIYNCFQSQRSAINNNSIDLIYANPFDAAILVREKGFQPLVRAAGVSDEAIIAVNTNNLINDVEHLPKGVNVAFTSDPDVYLMGMIMLEPADLNEENTVSFLSDSYVLVAKKLLKGQADVGLFLAEAYEKLSPLIKKQLKTLVKSQIGVIHHSLMLGPKLMDKKDLFQNTLLEMHTTQKGQGVLESLGLNKWEKVEEDEMEFMIDLMDTLKIEDSTLPKATILNSQETIVA